MTRSEAGALLRRFLPGLAASALGGLLSLAAAAASVDLAVRALQAAAGAEWAYYLKSLFADHAGFALACAAAAGAQYFAAWAWPQLPAGALRPLPGPAAGALVFQALSGPTLFGLYKYGWLAILLAGVLGALAAPARLSSRPLE